MPAILRIFLYQTDASLSVIGSCLSYGQSTTVARIERTYDLQHDVLLTVVYFRGVRYLFRMYCATPKRMKMAVQNRKCVSIITVLIMAVVMIGNDSTRPDHSGFTIPYRIFRRPGVIHWWFWFGRRGVYQCLPCLHSGSNPRACGLYQQLPPRPRTHN